VEIAAATHMGPVELSVADLEQSLAYWGDTVGLRVLAQADGTASLGADTELVRLVEEPGAEPARGYAGLYHVALLLPDRPALARWLAHAARERIPLEGLSDHAVSEAIYLRDPDQNGVELYWDRPEAHWPRTADGELAMYTRPLNIQSLLESRDERPPARRAAGLGRSQAQA